MAFGGLFHIGTFFIFAATVLLIVVSVSSPIWDYVGFLKIDLPNREGTIYLGNWGYCLVKSSGNYCTPRTLGYNLVGAISGDNLPSGYQTNIDISSTTVTTLHNLSRALILHPIAAGVSFLSFLTALTSHRIGFLFASLIAFVAALITLAALIIDFIEFGILKHHYNDSDGPGHGASYSVASWLVVAAFASLVLGTLTACCGCFTDRRRKNAY